MELMLQPLDGKRHSGHQSCSGGQNGEVFSHLKAKPRVLSILNRGPFRAWTPLSCNYREPIRRGHENKHLRASKRGFKALGLWFPFAKGREIAGPNGLVSLLADDSRFSDRA
jgi:hypothetical protein